MLHVELDELLCDLAGMGRLASQVMINGIAQRAATAIEHLDPLSGDRLARADDEIDALLRQLLRTLFAGNSSHGVEPVVHAALVGRYYERFADLAVMVARQVGNLATGRMRRRRPVTLRKAASVVEAAPA